MKYGDNAVRVPGSGVGVERGRDALDSFLVPRRAGGPTVRSVPSQHTYCQERWYNLIQ